MKGDFWREVKRKAIHAAGLIFVIPLWYLAPQHAIKFFAAAVIVAWFINWYWNRRRLRGKYIAQLAEEIPEPHRHDILKGAQQIRKFEEEVLFGFLKDVARKREKEPLAATFYYLLSTFLALALFGAPFAIFGLIAIAIGDSAATLVGKFFGKHKLWWNREKSFEGCAGFFAATSFSIFALLQLMPAFAAFSLLIPIVAGLAGAIIETIPTTNDNSVIPLAVAFASWLVFVF